MFRLSCFVHALQLADEVSIEAVFKGLEYLRVAIKQSAQNACVEHATSRLVGYPHPCRGGFSGQKAHLTQEIASASDPDQVAALFDTRSSPCEIDQPWILLTFLHQ